MQLGPIKPGDIIRWDDGILNYGTVMGKQAGCVVARLLRGGGRYNVKAREITGHWRMSGETTRREARVTV